MADHPAGLLGVGHPKLHECHLHRLPGFFLGGRQIRQPAGQILDLPGQLLVGLTAPIARCGELIAGLVHLLDVRGDHREVEGVVDFAFETGLCLGARHLGLDLPDDVETVAVAGAHGVLQLFIQLGSDGHRGEEGTPREKTTCAREQKTP